MTTSSVSVLGGNRNPQPQPHMPQKLPKQSDIIAFWFDIWCLIFYLTCLLTYILYIQSNQARDNTSRISILGLITYGGHNDMWWPELTANIWGKSWQQNNNNSCSIIKYSFLKLLFTLMRLCKEILVQQLRLDSFRSILPHIPTENFHISLLLG